MGFGIKIKYGVFAGVFCLTAGTSVAADCRNDVVGLRGDWGQAQFSVEIADDVEERAIGLMHRNQMARNAGMLFVYDRPQSVAFWMRNTLIPLDMLFIDPTGTVSSIHENAIPLDETGIPGGANIQYVLEVNGGLVNIFGITVGSQVLHPDIDQKIAVWPCVVQ